MDCWVPPGLRAAGCRGRRASGCRGASSTRNDPGVGGRGGGRSAVSLLAEERTGSGRADRRSRAGQWGLTQAVGPGTFLAEESSGAGASGDGRSARERSLPRNRRAPGRAAAGGRPGNVPCRGIVGRRGARRWAVGPGTFLAEESAGAAAGGGAGAGSGPVPPPGRAPGPGRPGNLAGTAEPARPFARGHASAMSEIATRRGRPVSWRGRGCRGLPGGVVLRPAA